MNSKPSTPVLGRVLRPAGVPPPRLDTRALDQLEQAIDALKVDFERYFNGGLAIPPVEQKEKVGAQLRKLRDRQSSNFADRFRLQQLEARYNSYSELQNRRLRDREEGRGAQAVQPGPAPRFDLADGVVIDERLDRDAVLALFGGLAKSENGTRYDLDTFRSYLAQQLQQIHGKTGCREVRFRLVVEDGKPKLKAKPIQAG